MKTERETLQEMLDLLDVDKSSAPAVKGLVAYHILRLILLYLISKVK